MERIEARMMASGLERRKAGSRDKKAAGEVGPLVARGEYNEGMVRQRPQADWRRDDERYDRVWREIDRCISIRARMTILAWMDQGCTWLQMDLDE